MRLGFSCLFHLCDLRFCRLYQLCELFLTFLSCVCVHVSRDAFSVDSRREPPLVEVVVYHRHATRAGSVYLSRDGLEMGSGWGSAGSYVAFTGC